MSALLLYKPLYGKYKVHLDAPVREFLDRYVEETLHSWSIADGATCVESLYPDQAGPSLDEMKEIWRGKPVTVCIVRLKDGITAERFKSTLIGGWRDGPLTQGTLRNLIYDTLSSQLSDDEKHSFLRGCDNGIHCSEPREFRDQVTSLSLLA